jgi:MotA/TolQ/ExbB proton channel family
VTRPQNRSSFTAMLGNLGWPLLLGAAMCSLFLAMLYQGPLHTPLMMRYFAGHPINLCTTVLFFVGLAALLFKFRDIALEYKAVGEVELPAIPPDGQAIEQVGSLLDTLAAYPARVQKSYIGRRLNDLLETVERKGAATGLDDELKYLADIDAARQQDSYALVRIVIWAAPMLGFLGTVVGITDALGDLGQEFASNKEAATNLGQAMNGLLSGLYVAFDTTAQALLLSMVLMFVQFLCDRLEVQVLSIVDTQVNAEMTGRFQDLGGGNDPHLLSIQRMNESMLRSTETLIERQANVWRKSFEKMEQEWSQHMAQSSSQWQLTLQTALDASLKHHLETLGRAEQASLQATTTRWEKTQTALLETTQALQQQQAEMLKQGQHLTAAVEATGEVLQLEKALNANLSALAGAKNFEETVVSLAAAVNLLSTRLGRSDATVSRIELPSEKTKGRAA